jgi:hypothetical protein
LGVAYERHDGWVLPLLRTLRRITHAIAEIARVKLCSLRPRTVARLRRLDRAIDEDLP